MAGEVGLVKRGTVSVDGSKGKASKHKAMSSGRTKHEEKRLRKEIRERMGKAHKADTQEDKRYGQDHRGDQVPAEQSRREDRLQKLQEARKHLAARQVEAGRHPDDQDRTGKPGKPFKRPFGEPPPKGAGELHGPGQSAHEASRLGFRAVLQRADCRRRDGTNRGATAVTQSASDVDPLIPLLDGVEEALGARAECYLAGAGYRSESNLQALEERGIDGDGTMGRVKAGKKPISPDLGAYGAEASHEAKPGEKTYRKRKWIEEPPFSWIQSAMGFDPFPLRGLL